MKRETLSAALLALLAVVALGVAAATLDTAVTVEGGGLGGGGGLDGAGPSEESEEAAPTESPGGETALALSGVCYSFLREPPALAVFGLLLLAVGLFAYWDTGSRVAGAVVSVTLGLPLGVALLLLSLCRPITATAELGLGGTENGTLPAGGGGAGGVGEGVGSVSTPEALFVAVIAVALAASLVALVAAAGDDDETGVRPGAGPDDDDPSDPDLAAVARTAGRAADRIESERADNEVYRAWRDMTEALDVDRPASSTPAEFAGAAIDAGVEEEPVARLTEAFERVRYGGEDATDDRERRAAAALRRIEEAHGGDE